MGDADHDHNQNQNQNQDHNHEREQAHEPESGHEQAHEHGSNHDQEPDHDDHDHEVHSTPEDDRTHVLVPLDATALLERVLSYAFDHHPNAQITVLHVATVPTDAPLEFSGGPSAWHDNSDAVFERANALAADYNRSIDTDVTFGQPARAILEYEQDEAVDAIVLGSHGRSRVEKLLLGSVANTVSRRASVPVTIVR
ncbi:UspA domain-containing protein [Natrialba chahannaoensis JCM 10990]|uniref:UspA domain-containing protein n=1 Tax=Natrialba chahannaoensis JCM 10990 TaxID=1227492 RepID=M0AQI1_9EURY|nr:universal stress protein [Natrialba chahannaoensis]ELZ00198.1 UspA domain-containing protein [Natrialba chahannaoensis JCM 10990]